MPELPEVEMAARQLRAWAQGKRIERVEVAKSRVIRPQKPADFAQLEGHTFRDVERTGKWMLIDLGRGLGLLSHLGMTGKWYRARKGEPAPSHVRATLHLRGGTALHYHDPRLFGRLAVAPLDELRRFPGLKDLGPDPLAGIDVERLHGELLRTRRSLKEALMDQRLLAGLGNIHVSESLHRAGLHPERPAQSVTEDESARLARAIAASLKHGLDTHGGGDEPLTYVEEGGDNPFLVYARAGEGCFQCGAEIERIVQGGRSSFFCPQCQPRQAGRPLHAGSPPGRRMRAPGPHREANAQRARTKQHALARQPQPGPARPRASKRKAAPRQR